ncbi:aliphatic sulfonate ABC transporter substrate-binding protein [Pseudolabrys taiwanensis]|uniref:Putative aliphatic sulfonates-binding protein n=1 Tax=Pseudolabrys taiwanensis TaxID=331696 RepID=A0A345ZXB5_9HYPH|nr:aliphatic sulfonate ABC transporter substrate-binding protein [Pseudolabrys taiwanensis]AXK81562.1 aliphatic sulfonate ABC transporter substrate-binding protein [Pseudolabrys taiwanensis]
MIANRFRRLGLAVIPLLVASTVAAAQDKDRTLRIGYQRSSTLITVLKSNGGLEKALAPLGVTITWHEFTSGLPQLEALNTGNIDFSADVADTVPIFAQAAGAKLAYVAQEAPSPAAQAILVPADSPIKSVADLKGKKVAVTKGAGSHYLLIAALAKAGLTSKDVTSAYLTPADGRAAFVSHNVDAWVAWDPFLSTARAQNNARVLTDGSHGLASYKRYYLASESYAARHGDILKVVYDQLDETGKWVKAKPEDAAKLLAGIWKIDPAIAAEAIANRSYKVGHVTREGLSEQKQIADAFYAAGLLPKKVDTTDVTLWQATN